MWAPATYAKAIGDLNSHPLPVAPTAAAQPGKLMPELFTDIEAPEENTPSNTQKPTQRAILQ